MRRNTTRTPTTETQDRRQRGGILALLLLLSLSALLIADSAAAQRRYWIDESTDFTGNGCPNTDLNNVTSSLRNRLNSTGWTGTRWSNANAWPEDFIEGNLGGIDGTTTDSRLLAVYAGHGNRGLIQFGFRRGGICTDSIPGVMRLGDQQGNQAGYAMWVTSCTVHADSFANHFNQRVRQTFGYHNSPPVKNNQPRSFYNATNGLRNSRAWLEEMEDRPGWFTGDNSPVALTFGLSAAHCSNVRDNARLRGGVFLSPSPEPLTNWCSVMFDNGDSGC